VNITENNLIVLWNKAPRVHSNSVVFAVNPRGLFCAQKGEIIMGNVTESIFSSDTLTVPLADIQHIENNQYGLMIITKHTKWNFEHDCWENAIFLPDKIKDDFIKSWCGYRHELELPTLKNLEPEEKKTMEICGDSCPFKTFKDA
jgi:hypothetical protein